MSRVDRYVRNALGLTVIQGMSMLVPIVLIPIIVRVEGIEQYGRYALVLTFYGFAATICDYGFDYSAVRELRASAGPGEARRRVIRETMSAKVVLFLVVAPTAALALFQAAGIHDILLVASGLLIPATSAVSVHWLYLADGKLLPMSAALAAARVVSLLIVFVVYPFLKSTGFVVAVCASLPILVQLWFWRNVEDRVLGSLSLKASLKGLQSGSTAGSMVVVSSYIAMSSVLVAPMVLSAREIGVFAAIERLMRGGFGITKPLLGALYPEMSSMYHEARRHWYVAIRKVVFAGLGLGLGGALIITVGWPIISCFLFNQHNSAGRLIAYGFTAWLTVGVINNGVGIQGLVASGGERAYRRALVIAAVVLTIGYYLLGQRGAIGLLSAMMIAELTLLGLNALGLRAVLRSRVA